MFLTKHVHIRMIAALTVLAAGCGQNPHITGGGGSAAPASANNSAQAKSASRRTTQDDSATAKNAQDATPTTTVVQQGPAVDRAAPKDGPKDGKDGKNGNVGATGEAGAKGLKGDKGEKGDRGADGKTITIITPAPAPIMIQGPPGRDACGDSPKTIIGNVTGVDAQKLAEVKKNRGADLPYFLSLPHMRYPKVDILSLGNANAGIYTSTPYVNDAEVLFNVEITLPQRRLVKLDNLSVKLDANLYKYSVDHFPDTEMICSLDLERCSGHEFPQELWKKLINPKFGNGNHLVNGYFAEELMAGINESKTRKGGRSEYRGMLSLDLAPTFAREGERLSAEELLDLLYGKDGPRDKVVTRTLHFLVADDTKVGSQAEGTVLKLNYVHDGCAELTKSDGGSRK